MNQNEDKYYIHKVLGGSPDSFAYIIDKYKRIAFTLALRTVKNREDAEEAVQDAFLKCYYALANFDHKSSFSTWLYRIVYNCSISRIRQRKMSCETISDDFEANIDFSESNSALSYLKHEDQKHFINVAINSIGSDDAMILTLYYQLDKSVEEISQIMEISKSNVKIKLFRSRKALKAALEGVLQSEVRNLL